MPCCLHLPKQPLVSDLDTIEDGQRECRVRRRLLLCGDRLARDRDGLGHRSGDRDKQVGLDLGKPGDKQLHLEQHRAGMRRASSVDKMG